MLTTFYPPYHFGGDATYVRALSEALVVLGHDVTVVHCEDAFRLKGTKADLSSISDSNVTVYRLKSHFGALSPFITQQAGHPGLKKSSLQEILKQTFDVVNFHNISLLGGPAILSMAKAPVKLYTLHEHWLVCATHIFWKNGCKPCDLRECISCCVRSGIPPQWWRYTGLIKRQLEHIDTLISPSQYTADKHTGFGIDRPVKVLPLFSNVVPDDQASYSGKLNHYLFVGRVTASKGIQKLVAFFARHSGYHLTIVGDGDLLSSLKTEHSGNQNLNFVGPVSQSALVNYYQQSTAVILPSLAPETFGLTIVEAYACGTPAIVRIAGGSREIVDRSQAGFLYQGDDELLDVMEAFVRNEKLREQLGEKARRAYEEHYTLEKHVNGYLALISDVLADKQTSSIADDS